MPQLGTRSRRWPVRRLASGAAVTVAVAVLAAACSSSKGETETTTASTSPTTQEPVAAAEARVAEAQKALDTANGALTSAGQQLCSDATTYVTALDRYGKLFTDAKATVGDVKAGGADLAAPRESVATAANAVTTAKEDVVSAEQELAAAQAALADARSVASSVPTSRDHGCATDHHDAGAGGHDHPGAAGRGGSGHHVVGHHRRHPADAGHRRVQLRRVRPRDRLAEAALRRGLPDRRPAGPSGREGDRVHGRVADRPEGDRLLQGPRRRHLRPADRGRGRAAAEGQRSADHRAGGPGHRPRARREARRGRCSGGGAVTHADLLGADSAEADRLLDGAHRRNMDPELTDALKKFQTALGVPPSGSIDAATLAAFEQAIAKLRTTATTTTTAAPPTTTASTTSTTTPASPTGSSNTT